MSPLFCFLKELDYNFFRQEICHFSPASVHNVSLPPPTPPTQLAFKIFCLSLVLSNLVTICLSIIFLRFLVLGSSLSLNLWISTFHHIWNFAWKCFSHQFFKYFLSFPWELNLHTYGAAWSCPTAHPYLFFCSSFFFLCFLL